eukprot:scaffold4261_cov110-Isochrysis_galbana.AAC.1
MCIAPSALILPSSQGWPPRLQGKQGEAQWTRQPLLTTKQAQFDLGWWKCKRALECGEHHVDLEALTDVLGAFRADAVVIKTARAKQGATTHCQPLLTTKRAHFGFGWWGTES